MAMYIWVQFYTKFRQANLFLKLKKVRKNIILDISTFRHPREISQNASGLYYVRRGAGYKIHICAKFYYLGRAIVSSSVAPDSALALC